VAPNAINARRVMADFLTCIGALLLPAVHRRPGGEEPPGTLLRRNIAAQFESRNYPRRDLFPTFTLRGKLFPRNRKFGEIAAATPDDHAKDQVRFGRLLLASTPIECSDDE